MIIKSLSRKTESFHQLVRYIFHDKEQVKDERQFTLLHRIYSDFRQANKEEQDRSLLNIADEFVQNQRFAKERKNGVKMYHEILSFDTKVRDEITKESLQEITQKYIEERAEKGLVLARPHFDGEHIHVHLMISGNEERSVERANLSRKEFEECKRITREFQRERYPQLSPVKELELGQKQHREYWKRGDRKAEMEKLGKPFTEKELSGELLIRSINACGNVTQIERFLKLNGVKTYRRGGKATGITVGKRNYRYGTLLKGMPHLQTKLLNMVDIDVSLQAIERSRNRSKKQDRDIGFDR